MLPENVEDVIARSLAALGRWRSFVIVVDGRSGLGKSVFGRYLSFRMEMPLYELDEFKLDTGIFAHKKNLFDQLKAKGKPVLAEGLCAAQVLAAGGIKTDWIIRLSYPLFAGPRGFRCECEAYERRFQPDILAKAAFAENEPEWFESG
jgi:hypothetical protein